MVVGGDKTVDGPDAGFCQQGLLVMVDDPGVLTEDARILLHKLQCKTLNCYCFSFTEEIDICLIANTLSEGNG